MATRTAAQERALAATAFDAYLAECPSRRLLDRVSGKWVSLVVCALGERSMRYSELRARIAAVSQKMLTQTLRNLERDGLVTRTVTAEVPVRVDYALTNLGYSLLEPIEHVKRWAETNMPKVDSARQDYDAGHAEPVRSRDHDQARIGAGQA